MKYIYTLENERGALSYFINAKKALAKARDSYNDYQGLDLYVKKWTQDDFGLPGNYVETIYHKDLRGYYSWLRMAVFKPLDKSLNLNYKIVRYVKNQRDKAYKLYNYLIKDMTEEEKKKFIYQKITGGIEDEI